MDRKKYNQLRAAVSVFISAIVAVSVIVNSYVLAAAGVLTGMAFMILVRTKAKIRVDEREKIVREKAAQAAYAIFAPTIGLGAFFLMMFSRGEYYYLESLGTVLAYLTLFLIAVYAVSYHFLNRKYGGSDEE